MNKQDLVTLAGVAGIVIIAVAFILKSPTTAHDIALASITGLGGWLGHAAIEKLTGGAR